jgi:hypothetical protein
MGIGLLSCLVLVERPTVLCLLFFGERAPALVLAPVSSRLPACSGPNDEDRAPEEEEATKFVVTDPANAPRGSDDTERSDFFGLDFFEEEEAEEAALKAEPS